MSYLLSVDLGTTFSAAALGGTDRIGMFQLGTHTATIPSVVAVRSDGMLVIGEAAARRAITEPTRVAREFKRRLGDPTPLVIGGTPYGAEALMAGLLRGIMDEVTARQDSPPRSVVLTHPANYGPYKIDLMEQVGHLAQIEDVLFVSEPQAAAVHYLGLERIEVGEAVAVYDLGGGTFDAAVVRRTDIGFDLIGEPDGLERFGGIDLDEAVFEHVIRSLGGVTDDLDPSDPAYTSALARLRIDCMMAKEDLSSDTDADIPVMLPNLHTEVHLTRIEFEDMIRPRLRETTSLLERVVDSAGLEFNDVASVLLVGGSSQIPLVSEMVREATGRPIGLTPNPKHAMALGAAAAQMGHLATDHTGSESSGRAPTPIAVREHPIEAEVDPRDLSTPEDGSSVGSEGETEVMELGSPAVAEESEGDGFPGRSRRRVRLISAAAVLIVVLGVVGGILFLGGGAGPPVAEIVVPVRLATTSDAAALKLVSGASWSVKGPIDVNGPNVDTAIQPDGILIGRMPQEPPGTPIEAVFEVTFKDVEGTLTFSLDRTDLDELVEISFPNDPSGWSFVAEGEVNPIEFDVERGQLSG